MRVMASGRWRSVQQEWKLKGLIMYSTIEEVREGIKDEVLSDLIGNEYIEDPDEREEKIKLIISEAIEDADGEIDGYLNRRYSVPFAKVPKVINKFSKDIAQYNIFSRMGIDENTREKTYLKRYESAIRFLENVAKGLIEIPLASDPEQPSRQNSDYRINSANRVFSRNSLRGL